MVDPTNNAGAISSLLRAQSAGIIALKTNQQATQAIINQLQKTASAPVAASAVPQTTKSGAPSGNLPRGSLVDILA